MGKFFRLGRPGLRSKISYIFALSVAALALILGNNFGTSVRAADPTFIPPVTIAGGNRVYYDMNLRIRPTDGTAFIIGSGSTQEKNTIGLSVTDPSNPDAPLGIQVINNGTSNPSKFPNLAFAPNGTGYAVWRGVREGSGIGNETFFQVIQPSYSANNPALGTSFFLRDRFGFQLDQPTIAVDSSGNILIVGYLVSDPVQLAMITLDPNTFNQIGSPQPIDYQPGGNKSEMDPQMCIDSSNNIHIVSLFPNGFGGITLKAYDRVGGGGFTSQDIYPTVPHDNGYYDTRAGTGRSGKDIACGADGTAYIALKNNGYYDLARRSAGAGQSWSYVKQDVFGIGGVVSVAVTTSPDGRVWAGEGDGSNRPGTYVKYSDDKGASFLPAPDNNAILVYNNAPDVNKSVAMDGNGPGGKVHLGTTFAQGPESAFYSYALSALAPATNLVTKAVNSKQINLNWTASTAAPDGYKIYRNTIPSFGGSPIATVGNVTSYQDNNLPYNSTFYYKITAYKSGYNDSVDSNIAGSTTFGPAAVLFNPPSPTSPGQAGVTGYSPTVTVVDVNGATVTNYSGTVQFSITPGTGEPNAVLSGTTTQTITNGVSTFPGVSTPLKIDGIGIGYRLRAAITPLGLTGNSSPFNLTGQLIIGTPTPPIVATVPFSVSVTVQNFAPATDTHYNGPVYLALSTNPNGAYFYGQTTAFAVSGVVTFTNLMIDTAAAGYGFKATLPNSLGTETLTGVDAGPYTEPGSLVACKRILFSPSVGTCSNSDLHNALVAAAGRPVYVDHRTATGPVGFGQSTYPLPTQVLDIPAGSWLDAGCGGTPSKPWGMQVTIYSTSLGVPTGTFTLLGKNNFLRGIYILGTTSPAPGGGAVLTVPITATGNTMSCDKVEYSAGT